jgi:putative DNA methylase
MMEVKTRKKLIEVALPLDAINTACAREKSIRHGHPSTLHLWWARRPLAAARSVIFSQMVDDPSTYVDELIKDSKLKAKAEGILRTRLKRWEDAVALAKKAEAAKIKAPPPGEKPTLEEVMAEIERERIFRLIEQLVEWENTTNEEVLGKVKEEIWKSWRRTCADNANHPKAKELFDPKKLPAFHDPFAGGGALPLEAQRLGLEAHGTDLNPVAVLINKAMIEIPPKFAGNPPVNPEARKNKELIRREWKGAQGLAEDVRYYGQWIRNEAENRIGHLYPKIEITKEMAKTRPDLKPYEGRELTVIAWLWARTVKSPNPAFSNIDVPLVSTFMLSTKAGKEAYVEPVIDKKGYHFAVKVGKPKDAEGAKNGTKLSRANFGCLMSGTPVSGDYIKAEGKAGRMGARLMAIVAEGDRGRVYLAPATGHEAAALNAKPTWRPEGEIAKRMTGGNCTPYGLTTWGDIFTLRQLVALTTFSDLVQEARERAQRDTLAADLPGDSKPLRDGGTGATAYAEAVAVYLAFAVSKMTNIGSSIASWMSDRGAFRETFARQAIPMTWDFAEANTFADTGGSFAIAIDKGAMAIDAFPSGAIATAAQMDAATQNLSVGKLVSTDPPYYDNIGYADLSDFFYVWLRRSLRPIFHDLFATLAVPKAEELVATPYRHGSKEQAETFFLDGMTQAMHRLAEQAHPAFPVTIYYAFKQSESDGAEGTASTGWETFLDAVIRAGFSVSGTWPMRTEGSGRMIARDTNALASSIVLVCRKRAATAPTATRRDFVSALKKELPSALKNLQKGNIAPVDLAQASIGPGMAIYTRYSKILDADGKHLSVRLALSLINQTLDEVLEEQEGEFDADTRWAIKWFEQYGFSEGPFGEADNLARAKVTAVNGLVEAGIIKSKSGKVSLLKKEQLEERWSPEADKRLTVWEIAHHLIRALDEGEAKASDLLSRIGPIAEAAKDLSYRLHAICVNPKNKWSKEAQDYDSLVKAWTNLQTGAKEAKTNKLKQGELI